LKAVEPERFDVAVIGGGVIGLTSALAAARAGRTVVVLESPTIPPATYAAAGMLSPGAELIGGDGESAQLALKAAERWGWFAETLNVDVVQSGTALVGWTHGDRAEVSRLTALGAQLGIMPAATGTVQLDNRLNPRFGEPTFFPDDSFVLPDQVTEALRTQLRDLGVTSIVRHVSEFDYQNRRILSETADAITADVIIIATGAARLVEGLTAPNGTSVRPIRGTTLQLRQDDVQAPLMARAIIDGQVVYVILREDGSAVIGATAIESDRHEAEAGDVADLLRLGIQLCPSLARFEFLEVRSGLRPVVDNGLPFLLELGPSLYWHSGYYRHGILMAPNAYHAVDKVLRA